VLFATVFAYVTQTTMQRYISPTNTALIFCMEPVFAALAAYIVIDERLTLRGYLGAGMILSGMLLAELSPGFFKNSRRRLRFSIPVQNLTARSKPEA
jgi:drug/metabolite transporter (DMT)-like permease